MTWRAISVRPQEEATLDDLREENGRLRAAAHVGKAGRGTREGATAAAAAEEAVAARLKCVVGRCKLTLRNPC
jgi:hypothetical protein